VFEYAAEDLERAWRATQKQGAGRPRFERFNSLSGGFAVDGSIRVEGAHIRLPKLGELRLTPNGRARVPDGLYAYARVVREHGEWFVSVLHKVNEPVRVADMTPTIGLDWGVRKLATLSDGTRFENPKALEQVADKAETARQSVARKLRVRDSKLEPPKKGERRPQSKRLLCARRRLGGCLKRAADIRKNAVHHATAQIARDHAIVGVEALKPKNMTQKRVGRGRAAKASLNRRILDAAPGMFLSILNQKLRDRRGGGNIAVNPAYSSQDCSASRTDGAACGARNDCGSNEIYVCATCGSVVDRDVNAAKNILARARAVAAGWSATEKARGVTVRPYEYGKPSIRLAIGNAN